MQSYVASLLLFSVLYVVSDVKAANKVTLNDFNADIPDNAVVDSWSYELNNNLINSNINIKQNCPGLVLADIKIYKDGAMINQMTQNLNHPIQDLENYKVCGSLDSPELEDDSCSIAEGEQIGKDCDLSDFFSDMSPGDYRVECNFKQDDNIVATVTINLTVEGE